MEIKSSSEYMQLGVEIDKYIKKINELDYDFYKITSEQREIFKIIDCMEFIQWYFNKGIRLDNYFNKVEIYDIHKEQDEMDNMMKNFKL